MSEFFPDIALSVEPSAAPLSWQAILCLLLMAIIVGWAAWGDR